MCLRLRCAVHSCPPASTTSRHCTWQARSTSTPAAAMSAASSSSRPLGLLEQFYAFTSYQRMFSLTIQHLPHDVTLDKLVSAMLSVVRQPLYGSFASYLQLGVKEADARWHVVTDIHQLHSFVQNGITIAEHGEPTEVLQQQLAQDFALHDTTQPLWRVVLLPVHRALILTVHHAIADGLSAVMVVQALLQQLASPSTSEPSGSITPTLSPPVDHVLPPALGIRDWLGTVREVLASTTPFYTGSDLVNSKQDVELQRTAVVSRLLEPTVVNSLKQRAKQQNTTVHGLLVAACIATATTLNSTAVCKCITPISLRSHSSTPLGTGCYITSHTGCYAASATAASLQPRYDATKYCAELQTTWRSSYKQMIGQLTIASWLGMQKIVRSIADKLVNRRTATLECSNLGVVQIAAAGFEDVKVSFAQRAHNDSALLIVSVVSTPMQGMNITLSYCPELINSERADECVTYLISTFVDNLIG